MKKSFLVVLVMLFTTNSCTTVHGLIHKNREFHIASVNNNVCKKLKKKVVVYAIFVDSRYTNPWTEHDIFSTVDSINFALKWVVQQAKDNDVELEIELDYHQNDNQIIPIEGRLSRKTLSGTLFAVNGIKNIDRWADKIGNVALRTFEPDNSIVTKTKIKPKDRERLIARLRDLHKTDNVALMYFINNYYTDELSCAVHCSSNDNPEYAIVSFKQPAVIAHEFLHLFGAWDLYITPFDNKRAAVRKKAFAMKEFPNEIMAFAHRGLDSLSISPFTKYLVGWEKELDENYKNMIIGKRLKVAKY